MEIFLGARIDLIQLLEKKNVPFSIQSCVITHLQSEKIDILKKEGKTM